MEESDTHQAEHDCDFEEENLEVVLEEIHDHSGSLIGGHPTFTAIKNEGSYIVATDEKGVLVIDERTQIFLDKLPPGPKRLSDLVYANHLDSYLLDFDGKIYRKDIDENPPYLFIDLDCGQGYGRNFKYSQLNKRLIVLGAGDRIVVVNLETKQVEIEIKPDPDDPYTNDLILFGRKEDKLVWITHCGVVNLASLNYGSKEIASKNGLQVQLIEERGEYP